MKKGGIKIMFLLGIIVIIFASAVFVGVDKHPAVQELQEQAVDVVEQNNQKIVDKVVEEGRAVVGEKLKEAGETMLSRNGEKGALIAYDETMIGKRDYTVLFFTAPWCPSCVDAEQDIKRYQEGIPGAVTIMTANFEDAALREKYRIDIQHTFVLLDAAGNEQKRWTNSMTLMDIITHITE